MFTSAIRRASFSLRLGNFLSNQPYVEEELRRDLMSYLEAHPNLKGYDGHLVAIVRHGPHEGGTDPSAKLHSTIHVVKKYDDNTEEHIGVFHVEHRVGSIIRAHYDQIAVMRIITKAAAEAAKAKQMLKAPAASMQGKR
ncbi:hypothetical protein A0H81_12052 [Grifola frondosa]|uniref:Uncharacterized protein n=1 Tax=Grifola frondosa TaxID=5627 RepID=A0A1C7LTU4_GRIFR|nr:hypothetical protein A0H81_12052 [Grifola frondosa]